jgi:hypothetical protein
LDNIFSFLYSAFGYDLHKLRLRVNQTRASFPLGTAVDAGMIANCVNSGIDDKVSEGSIINKLTPCFE